jgi:hypothetical protein
MDTTGDSLLVGTATEVVVGAIPLMLGDAVGTALIREAGLDGAAGTDVVPQTGAAVSVTHVVTHSPAVVLEAGADVLGGACWNDEGMSWVGTALHEHDVPLASAHDAMTLHVAGIMAPDERATQQALNPSEPG